MKNILIGIGIIAIVLFFVFLVVGFKVVSTVVVYVVGTLAILALIGFIIYFFRKITRRQE